MVPSAIYDYLSISKIANVLSLILLEIQHIRKVRLFKAFDDFKAFCIFKSIKDETFFFLQLIENQKKVAVTIYQ